MSQAEFVRSLEAELQLHGVPFDLGALLAFVGSVWPMAEEDPDVNRWAGAFLETTAVGVSEGL